MTNFGQLFLEPDWLPCFLNWLSEASKTEISDANACSLATVDKNGYPNVRMVLAKEIDSSGFVFFTNYHSTKAQELFDNPNAALCFHWKSLKRQIRIRGKVEVISSKMADRYFATRPYLNKIGAWASRQSQPLKTKDLFQQEIERFKEKFPRDDAVPRPSFWSGFILKPLSVEFWQDELGRLHDRILFKRNSFTESNWNKILLYP